MMLCIRHYNVGHIPSLNLARALAVWWLQRQPLLNQVPVLYLVTLGSMPQSLGYQGKNSGDISVSLYPFTAYCLTACVPTTVHCQSPKSSIHLRDQWETIASSPPFTALHSHKEGESFSVSPDKVRPPHPASTVHCSLIHATETIKSPISRGGDGGGGGRNTHDPSKEQTNAVRSTGLPPPKVELDRERDGGDSSGNFLVFDSNTIYILAAVGGVLLVILITVLLLAVVCLCKSRQRRVELARFKRSDTTRSSNASDFVYNSAYEWTCRQTRLLDHLRPYTTGYQSHWSLTRDLSSSKKGTLLQRNNSQKETRSAQPDTAGRGDRVERRSASKRSSSPDAHQGGAGADDACVENKPPRGENLENAERAETTSQGEGVGDDTDAAPQLPTEQDPGPSYEETTGAPRCSQCNGGAVDMYSNPLYARRKEQGKRRERERWRGERGDRKGRLNEGETEEGEERQERERQRERRRESERSRKDHTPQKGHSAALFVAPIEPLSSFLLSDSETYDSGNASAVSMDISSVQLASTTSRNQDPTSRADADQRHAQQQTATVAVEGGIMESNSFEFANNAGDKR